MSTGFWVVQIARTPSRVCHSSVCPVVGDVAAAGVWTHAPCWFGERMIRQGSSRLVSWLVGARGSGWARISAIPPMAAGASTKMLESDPVASVRPSAWPIVRSARRSRY